jgi:hypothetical protein
MHSTRCWPVVLALVVGCAASPAARAPESTPPALSVAAPTASGGPSSAPSVSAAPPASASATPPPAFPVVGIAECDAYLARYRACMSKQHDPAEVDARARTMAAGWRKAGESDAGRSAMVNACTQATAALAKVPGCEP